MGRKKKEYPLEVSQWDGACFSRGHHDKELFRREMQNECELDAPIEHIHHLYYKLTPSTNWNDANMTWVDVKPTCRGAVPFTVSEECNTVEFLEVEQHE